MTAENFDRVINDLCNRKPFQVFTVELMTGDRIEIDSPRAIVNRDGVAVFVAPGGISNWFDHDSVNRFIDTLAERV